MPMTFHYLLMAGHAIYLKQLMTILSDTGLTSGQPKVLDFLAEHDGVTQTEIAKACHIEAATLTSVLNGMEAKSLIERKRKGGNRRSFYIHLTDRGRELGRQVTAAFAKLEEDTFRDVSEEKKQFFLCMFRELYEKMETVL